MRGYIRHYSLHIEIIWCSLYKHDFGGVLTFFLRQTGEKRDGELVHFERVHFRAADKLNADPQRL